MAEEYIIGNNAQFNENVDILGKLNLFDSINQVEKFVLNLDSKEKLRITSDGVTFTDTLTAPSGNFSGIVTASSGNFSGIVTATKFSGPLDGMTGNFTGIITATGLDINGNADVSGNLSVGGVVTYEDVTNVDSVGLITARSGIVATGVVTATSFSGDGSNLTGIEAFVSGMIIIWSGAANAIPSGFVLCDGNNSTPDLRNRFVIGSGPGSSYPVNQTGGSANATLPSHYHNFPGDDQLSGANGLAGWTNTHDGNYSYDAVSSTSGGGKMWRTSTKGSSATNANLPRYYALCYIMKT